MDNPFQSLLEDGTPRTVLKKQQSALKPADTPKPIRKAALRKRKSERIEMITHKKRRGETEGDLSKSRSRQSKESSQILSDQSAILDASSASGVDRTYANLSNLESSLDDSIDLGRANRFRRSKRLVKQLTVVPVSEMAKRTPRAGRTPQARRTPQDGPAKDEEANPSNDKTYTNVNTSLMESSSDSIDLGVAENLRHPRKRGIVFPKMDTVMSKSLRSGRRKVADVRAAEEIESEGPSTPPPKSDEVEGNRSPSERGRGSTSPESKTLRSAQRTSDDRASPLNSTYELVQSEESFEGVRPTRRFAPKRSKLRLNISGLVKNLRLEGESLPVLEESEENPPVEDESPDRGKAERLADNTSDSAVEMPVSGSVADDRTTSGDGPRTPGGILTPETKLSDPIPPPVLFRDLNDDDDDSKLDNRMSALITSLETGIDGEEDESPQGEDVLGHKSDSKGAGGEGEEAHEAPEGEDEVVFETPEDEVVLETPEDEVVPETPEDEDEVVPETPEGEVLPEGPESEDVVVTESPEGEDEVVTESAEGEDEIVPEGPEDEEGTESPEGEDVVVSESSEGEDEVVPENPEAEVVPEDPEDEVVTESPEGENEEVPTPESDDEAVSETSEDEEVVPESPEGESNKDATVIEDEDVEGEEPPRVHTEGDKVASESETASRSHPEKGTDTAESEEAPHLYPESEARLSDDDEDMNLLPVKMTSSREEEEEDILVVREGTSREGEDIDETRQGPSKQMNMRDFLQKLTTKLTPHEARRPWMGDLLGNKRGTTAIKTTQQAVKAVKTKEKKPLPATLPKGITKEIFSHFAKCKLTADGLEEIMNTSEKYWKNVSLDLVNFMVARKGSKGEIVAKDVRKIMSRQGLVSSDASLFALIEEYLPAEHWNILIPTAFAKDNVYPKD